MASNGRLPASSLAAIPGGRLSREAAGAWNAGPARAGLRPSGPRASYRTYAEQVYFWNLYLSGRGNLAARPGSSNHGLGKAVDLLAQWMRAWMNAHGARYGWRKVEAYNEWWHVNFVGGVSFRAKPNALQGLTRSEAHHARSLLYRRQMYRREARSGRGRRYKRWFNLAKRERRWIVKHRRALRADARAKGGWKKDNRGARSQTLKRVLEGKIK